MDFVDRQAGPCMGRCMGGCMGGAWVMCCWGVHKRCVVLLGVGGLVRLDLIIG